MIAGREAMRRFEFMYEMVADRIKPDTKILDVGCNTGFFLEQWYQKGFKNLHGLDPATELVKYAQKNRPYMNVTEGYFGPKKFDIECDLLVFFGSIFRVPYGDRLFDALDRTINDYAPDLGSGVARRLQSRPPCRIGQKRHRVYRKTGCR